MVDEKRRLGFNKLENVGAENDWAIAVLPLLRRLFY